VQASPRNERSHWVDVNNHLIRNTFHLAFKQDWDALKRDVKPIYTAVNAAAGQGRARRADGEMGPMLRRGGPALGERVERVRPVPRRLSRGPFRETTISGRPCDGSPPERFPITFGDRFSAAETY
jgi:hypothetical protein